MHKEIEPHWLTVRQTAAYLNISETTVRRLVNEGSLNAIKVGRAVRIERSSLQRFAQTNRYVDLKRREQPFIRRLWPRKTSRRR